MEKLLIYEMPRVPLPGLNSERDDEQQIIIAESKLLVNYISDFVNFALWHPLELE